MTGIRVLVVDDEPTARWVAEGMLVGGGIDVTVAEGVDEALGRLRSGATFDVVLTDLMMPRKDGFDLLREIRDDATLAALPVVFVTAAADRAARLRALEAGADELLAKPIDETELLARIRSLASLTRARREAAAMADLNSVAATIGEGLLVVDAAGVVVRANEVAEALLGVADIEGRPVSELLPGPFEVVEGDARVGPGRTLLRRDAVADGVELWLTADVAEREDGGRAIAVRDARDERRRERWSDTVISGFAHELRTPLTGLLGGLELLDETCADPRVMEMLRTSASRLERAITRTLAYADEVTHEGPTRQVTITGTDELLDLVPGGHQAIAEAAELELDGGVEVDAPAIEATLEELLDNASRFADGTPVELALVVRGDALHLTVRDHGRGFPTEDTHRLVDLFAQVDRTGQSPGIGVGLARVQHHVRRLGGTISISRRDAVTEVEVVLPVRRVALAGAAS